MATTTAEDLDAKAAQKATNMNYLLKRCGIPVGTPISKREGETLLVGASWCKYSRSFSVFLPTIAAPAIRQVTETFQKAGYVVSSHTTEDIGAPGYTQISADIE